MQDLITAILAAYGLNDTSVSPFYLKDVAASIERAILNSPLGKEVLAARAARAAAALDHESAEGVFK